MGEARSWLYLETSFKHGDPVVAAASWGDVKWCGVAARMAVVPAWRNVSGSNSWLRVGVAPCRDVLGCAAVGTPSAALR